jgi:hypothetical protein
MTAEFKPKITYRMASMHINHTIDPDTVGAILAEWASPLAMADSNKPWVLDIPKEHATWLTLKGLL